MSCYQLIQNVSIGNTAGRGMAVVDSKDTVVQGCHIYGIGCSAMSIVGGDRPTLTPGNITVSDKARVTHTRVHTHALVHE